MARQNEDGNFVAGLFIGIVKSFTGGHLTRFNEIWEAMQKWTLASKTCLHT